MGERTIVRDCHHEVSTAHEATGEARYLDRALTIAESLTVDLTPETDGLIWEHYTADWEHDFEYNPDYRNWYTK